MIIDGTAYRRRADRMIFRLFVRRLPLALVNSLKLAGLAFIIVVPLGVLGGVAAARKVGRWSDRAIIIVEQSLGVVLEFISSIVLILPSPLLVVIFFGYVARARAGTVEALDADYARTALLKGQPRITVLTVMFCAMCFCRRSPLRPVWSGI
jgi:ABC-type dipeptide/oligopeptide/nickel transport system permease component